MRFYKRQKLCAVLGATAMLGDMPSLASDLGAFFSTNVLAVVTGYQTERTLSSGITVPLFSITPEAGDGTENGILFYVVAPTNMAGRFFWMHHDGVIASGKSFKNYNPDTLYSFRYNTSLAEEGHASVMPSDLFKIDAPSSSLCSVRPLGLPFFSSSAEILRGLTDLDARLETMKREISSREEMLVALPHGSRLYRREEMEIRFLSERIEKLLPEQRKELLDRLQDVQANEDFLKLLKKTQPSPQENESKHFLHSFP